jgi:hypothetical protein
MIMMRLFLLAMAGGAFSAGTLLRAQAPAPAPAPVIFDKSFRAEQQVTMRDGTSMATKVFFDNGKIRVEMAPHGMNVTALVLPDAGKVYSILDAQKMVMVMPYDAAKYKMFLVGTPSFDGKIEQVGTETINGIFCNKYKVTAANKIYDFWIDAAKKQPVKIAAEDGAFTATWKNYQAGPQDPALFVVPADYQMVVMPSLPAMPSSAPGTTPGL